MISQWSGVSHHRFIRMYDVSTYTRNVEVNILVVTWSLENQDGVACHRTVLDFSGLVRCIFKVAYQEQTKL